LAGGQSAEQGKRIPEQRTTTTGCVSSSGGGWFFVVVWLIDRLMKNVLREQKFRKSFVLLLLFLLLFLRETLARLSCTLESHIWEDSPFNITTYVIVF